MEGVTFLSRSRTLYGFLNEKGRCSSYKNVFCFRFLTRLLYLTTVTFVVLFRSLSVYHLSAVGELVLVQNLHTLELLNSNQSINLISAIIGSDVMESTPHGSI